MRAPTPHLPPLRALVSWLTAIAAVLLAAAPAGAQYGGGPNLFVDPVRIEILATYDAFGNACPAGSTVTLTIDGISGVQGTTTTAANGIFSFDDLPAPPEFVPGTDYTVRASCAGDSAIFVVTAVCVGGNDPVDGSCDNVTNTIPGGGGTSIPGGGGPGGGSGSPGPGDGLAITGLTRLELSLQIGVTMIAAGFLFALFARRSDRPDSA